MKEWENQIALFAVGIHIEDLKEKYRDNTDITNYLKKVEEDILENLDYFRGEEPDEEVPVAIPMMLKRSIENPTDRYKVNLLVDNSRLTGAPVIVDYNPTYYNLLGRVDYENEFGTITSDYSMVKPGLFHQANGGYLMQILDVNNLSPGRLSFVKNPANLHRVSKTDGFGGGFTDKARAIRWM